MGREGMGWEGAGMGLTYMQVKSEGDALLPNQVVENF